MTANWTVKRLDEACDFYNGLWKGEKEPFVNVGVIRNTNFTKEGWLDDSDIAYLDVESRKFEKRRLQHGDVILEKSGGGPKQAVGRVVLFDKKEGDFSFSNFTSAIRVREPDLLDCRFLHMFLHWTYVSGVTEKIQSNSTGIRNLDGNAYKAIEISFPALKEQQRIVAILDEAFAGIASAKANAERNLDNSSALFKRHLRSTFSSKNDGWLEGTLGEMYDVRDGTHDSPKYQSVGFPLITSKNLKREGLSFEDVRFISDEDYAKINARSEVHKGDVLFAMIGTIGNPTVVEVEPIFSIKNVALFKMQGRQSGAFLSYYLKTDEVISKMMREAKGTTQKFVGLGYLRSFPVSLPVLKIQNQIVRELDKFALQTRRLESIYTRKLTVLDELKQSLLHQAFSGQL